MKLIDQFKIQAMYSRQASPAAQDKQIKEVAALDLTRDGIDAMSKADVVELLQAHGATVDGRKSVATLRDELTKIMFAGL
jgi:hypothetical protein